MSSDQNVRTSGEQPQGIRPGEQVAVTVDPVEETLDVVPPEAYENLLVVSSRTPGAVARSLEERGVDLSRVGLIPVSNSPVRYSGRLSTMEAVPPEDLTGLSMALVKGTSALSEGQGWILFDAVDLLLTLSDEQRAVQFVEHVANLARDRDLRGIFPLVPAAMDDQTEAALRRSIDRVIEYR